jgi:hypothetical protein
MGTIMAGTPTQSFDERERQHHKHRRGIRREQCTWSDPSHTHGQIMNHAGIDTT